MLLAPASYGKQGFDSLQVIHFCAGTLETGGNSLHGNKSLRVVSFLVKVEFSDSGFRAKPLPLGV